MGLSEDLQDYLREEEQRKTTYGGLEQQGGYIPYSAETYDPQATPMSDRFFMWDFLGQSAWKFADELLFGLPGIAAEQYAPEFTEEYLQPTGLAGKVGGAIGGLGGFVKGPLAAGNLLVKGGAKAVGRGSSEAALRAASKDLSKGITSKAARETAETNISSRLRGVINRAKMDKDIALNKGFRKGAFKEIDEGALSLREAGIINEAEQIALSKTYKKYFYNRPVDDFIDIITKRIPGEKGYNIGRMVHEATVFGMIDAVHEGISSAGRGHEYDWTAPIWGVGVGAGFGSMGWFLPNAGKATVTQTDFWQGVKGVFNRPVKGSSGSMMVRAGQIGDDMERIGRHKWNFNGKEVDLRSSRLPAQLSVMGEKEKETFLRGLLTDIRNKEGKTMMKWALVNDWKSTKENWPRMVLGTMIMNARSFKEMAVDGHEIPTEDLMLNVLIGAFINRKGNPRVLDMFPQEMSQLRRNLKVLGIDTKNAFEHIPTLHNSREGHINPLNNDPKLKEIVEFAEGLGMSTDNFESIGAQEMRQTSASVSKYDLRMFQKFMNYMQSAGNRKYVKPLSSITEVGAIQVENKLRALVGKGKNVDDLMRYFDRSIDRSNERLDQEISHATFEIGEKLGLDIDSPIHGTMGKLPKYVMVDSGLENLARDGKVRFLRDEEGKILDGSAATNELHNIALDIQNVFELTRSTLLKAGSHGQGSKENTITLDVANVESVHDVIRNRERSINTSLNVSKDGYKFNFRDIIAIQDQMQPRRLNMATKLIDSIFEKDTPAFLNDVLPHISKDSGIGMLQPDPMSFGGGKLIDSANKLRIVDTNNPTRTSRAREFLNTVLEILSVKGTYEIDSASKSSEVSIHTIENFMNRMNELGMATDIPSLRILSRELTTNILRDRLNNSNLTDGNISTIKLLMTLPLIDGKPGIKYRMVGDGLAAGFSMHKLRTDLKENVELVNAVESWNKMYEELKINGKMRTGEGTLIKPERELTINTPDFVGSMELIQSEMIEGNKGTREQLNDMISIIEGPNRYKTALAIAINNNPEKAGEIVNLLESEGIIVRKTKRDAQTKAIESVKFEFSKDSKVKFEDAEVQSRLDRTLESYGLNKETIDQVYDAFEKSQELMIDESFGAGDKNMITEQDFFVRYKIKDYQDNQMDKANRDAFLDGIMWDTSILRGHKVFNEKAVDRLVKEMEYDDTRSVEAFDHAIYIVSNRLTQKNREVLYYADGSIKKKNTLLTFKDNRLVELLEKEIGLDFLFLDGMASDWERNDYGQLSHRSYHIFQKDASTLPDTIKDAYTRAHENFKQELDAYKTDTMSEPGISMYAIPGSNYVLGIPREYHIKVRNAFKKLVDKYPKAEGNAKNKLDNTMKLLNKENKWTDAHSNALDSIILEKMAHGSQENRFLDYLAKGPANKDVIDLISRSKLFFTPNFTPVKKDLMKAITQSGNYAAIRGKQGMKDIVNKYLKKDGYNAVTWDDKAFAQIRDRVADLLPSGYTWENLLGNRASTSGYDSLTFISRDMADFLSVYTGNNSEIARIFKPIINSGGENVWMFGKTVFAFDPYVQKTFFNKHKNVDIVTTRTSDKLETMQGNYIEKAISDIPGITKAEIGQHIYKLPLEAIGIKDVPKKDSPAKVSQSLFQSYIDAGIESRELFDAYYGDRLTKGMKLINTTLSNPVFENIMIREIKGLGSKYEDMAVKSEAAAHQGLFLDYITHSKYATAGPFGDNMMLNILQSKFITPSLAPLSYFEYGGQKYDFGGKSVMIQSLDPKFRDLAPTVVNSDGTLKQYGEMYLGHHLREKPIEIPGQDMDIMVINSKNNEMIPAKEWFTRLEKNRGTNEKDLPTIVEEGWDFLVHSQEPLGFLHDTVKRETDGRWQVGIVTSRFPRTRPNDLAILRLRDFLDAEYGNGVIINDFDVLNIFEGDYDYDKADFFWMNNKRVYKHINDARRYWVHTADMDMLETTRPGVEILPFDASNGRQKWDQLHSDNLVMGDIARGIAQGTVTQFNHLRNMAEKTVDAQGNERYVLMRLKDGTELTVDWDNREWFMRHAFESQHILDQKLGRDKSLMKGLFEMRGDYFFPKWNESLKKEDFRLDNAEGFDQTKMRQFLEDKSKGRIKKRIRIFRKYDKNGEEIRELNPIDKDIIRILARDYNKMLNLAPGRQTNSSEGRRKSTYTDMLDISNEYFNNYSNFETYIYTQLRNIKDENNRYTYNKGEDTDFSAYFGMKQVPYKAAKNKKYWADKDYDKGKREERYELTDADSPKPDKYWWFTGENKDSPFPQAVVNNAKARSKGDEGSLIERAMHRVWSNPMERKDPIVLSGDRYARFEALERELLGNDRFKLEEIGHYIPTAIKDVQRAKSEILRLKYTAARVANNWKMQKQRKKDMLRKLNESIESYESQILPLLTNEYRKSKRARDIGKISLVEIANNRDIIEATVQKFTTHNLTNTIGGSKSEEYWESLGKVRKKVAEEWSEYFDYASYNEFKERGIMDSESREARAKRKEPQEIEQTIEDLMSQYVADYGIRWLYDFANPAQSPQGTVGIFGGRVSPIALKKSTNYKRALKWLLKVHKGLIEGRQTSEDMLEAGQILTQWQKLHYIWTNRFHGNVKNIPISDIEWFHQLRSPGQEAIPGVDAGVHSMFRNYRDFRWDRKIDHESPWGMDNDNTMSFFRTLFDLKSGEEGVAEFEAYNKELSYINQLRIENQYMHPVKYMALMKGLEGPVNDIVQRVYSGTFDVSTGKVDPIKMNALKQNPMYIMVGGTRFQGRDGVTLNVSGQMNEYNRSAIQRIIEQATNVSETPQDNRFVDFFERNKIEGVKCK